MANAAPAILWSERFLSLHDWARLFPGRGSDRAGRNDIMTKPFEPRTTPWTFDDDDFYELESPRERIEFLLQYAILAPSGHNQQPWAFQITPEGVEVFADATRRLAVIDPSNREMTISLGAAIANLASSARSSAVTRTGHPLTTRRSTPTRSRLSSMSSMRIRKRFTLSSVRTSSAPQI
jgi:hypothetical protein